MNDEHRSAAMSAARWCRMNELNAVADLLKPWASRVYAKIRDSKLNANSCIDRSSAIFIA